jgi:hypothetical protein
MRIFCGKFSSGRERLFAPKVLRYFIFARLELWYNIGENE